MSSKLAIVLNDDGSIYKLILPKYVNQGSDYGDLMFVGFKEQPSELYTVIARFRLPNGDTNQLTMSPNSHQSIQGTPYTGWSALLTAAQTLYAGILYVSFEIIDSNLHVLYSIPAKITVNPTTYQPDDEDVNINNAEYENIALQLTYLATDMASQNYVLTKITEAQLQPGITLQTYVNQGSSNGVTSNAVYNFVTQNVNDLRTALTDGILVVDRATNADNAAKAQKAISTMFTLDENGDVAGFLHTTIPGANNRGMNEQASQFYDGDNTTTSVNSGGDNPDRGPYVDEMHKNRNYLILIQYRDYGGTECMASCGVMRMFPGQLIETPLFRVRGNYEGTYRYIKAQFTPPSASSEETRVKCSIWVGNFNGTNAYVESRPYLNNEDIMQILSNHLPRIYFREIK